MEISSTELDNIRAKAMLEGAILVLTGFKIGIKEVSRFTESMTIVDINAAIDTIIKESEQERAELS